MIAQTIIWLQSGTGAAETQCIYPGGWALTWVEEGNGLKMEAIPLFHDPVCLHLPIQPSFPYNEPPEAQRGTVTCPRSHSTLRDQASATLRTTSPILVLFREESLLCCFLAV